MVLINLLMKRLIPVRAFSLRNPPSKQEKSSFYTTADYNPNFNEAIKKQYLIRSDKPYRFAIVGTGPAGFYMAKSL
jgi:hypothetical protein